MNTFNSIPVLVLLFLSATSVIMGDYFAKSWSQNQSNLFLILSLLGYFLSGVFYIPTLLRDNLITTSIIWSLLGIIGFLFIGFIIFKETLSSLQLVGLFFGIISLLLLSLNSH
jgi:multidrug transporter EmrE-like cation transporter